MPIVIPATWLHEWQSVEFCPRPARHSDPYIVKTGEGSANQLEIRQARRVLRPHGVEVASQPVDKASFHGRTQAPARDSRVLGLGKTER